MRLSLPQGKKELTVYLSMDFRVKTIY